LKVAVIGSGLAAIGSIRALLKLGIHPVVIDKGEQLDGETSKLVVDLAKKNPSEWLRKERDQLSQNKTLTDGSNIPKKLAFGSDYFYGKSKRHAPICSSGNIPPLSYAIGGLSVGWGAAVLPPHPYDLTDWPVKSKVSSDIFKIIYSNLPYSAVEDELNINFPIYSESASPLEISSFDRQLLQDLRKFIPARKDDIVYGQSRLLVHSPNSYHANSCQLCGQCMSGCVYDSIYKSNTEILNLSQQGKITYRPNNLVTKLSSIDGKVCVQYQTEEGFKEENYDKVFLAAGAVNSTRIILNSLGRIDQKISLKSRGGFILPILSLRPINNDWPNVNTMPGIFIELKGSFLKHWVHMQLSTTNEMVIQKLKVPNKEGGWLGKLRRIISNHLMIALVNFHSDHSGEYKLWISKPKAPNQDNEQPTLNTKHIKKMPQLITLIITCLRLTKVFGTISSIPLFPFARLNSGSYHVGCSLPMKENPSNPLETDTCGRISDIKNLHVVDTSVFPSLPGTTIGTLIMANAYRIVTESLKPRID
jgi:hypothetical protein